MNKFIKYKFLDLFLLIGILGIFAIFYYQTVMWLPLFGDATIHGYHANEYLQNGWQGINAEYPSFYYVLMAILFLIFGEKGFNLVPYIGVFFLLLAIYLLVRLITQKKNMALFSVLFVGCSPKIIYYSSRMYQEIFMSGFFIFTIFLFFKYLKNKNSVFLFLLSFFLGISISIKQQGLIILFSSFLLYLLADLIRRKINLLNLLVVFFIPLIMNLGFYGVLFHNYGKILPGSDEFKFLKIINKIGQQVFGYKDQKLKLSQNNTENKLKEIESLYSDRAFKRAESRHIRTIDIFTDFTKFNQTNSLYIDIQGKKLETEALFYISFISLFIGFFYALYHIKTYKAVILFSFIFIPINYVLFARNTDQQRYHLFLPIFLSIFSLICLDKLFSKFELNKYFKYLLIVFFSIIYFIPIIIPRIILNKRWVNSQSYSPSIGGIESVKETGKWLNNNTNKDIIIGQQCGNEIQYYSNRKIIGDWRINFLEIELLKTFFIENHINYFIIAKSQISKDEDWEIICWIPNSFYNLMEENFEIVFKTSQEDIFIYKTI